MAKKKVDLGKLVTARSYAEMKGVNVRTVQYWISRGVVKSEIVDGVRFVVLTDTKI
jgi:phage terminase Nu1 subunit (DNA packaging protein)